MRFGLKIGQHDRDVKLRKVSQFLKKDYRVKMSVFLRGREVEHKDLAFKMAQSLVDYLNSEDQFNGSIVVEQPPKLAGRLINLVVRNSSKQKNDQSKKSDAQRQQGSIQGDQKRQTPRPTVAPQSQSQ